MRGKTARRLRKLWSGTKLYRKAKRAWNGLGGLDRKALGEVLRKMFDVHNS